MISKTSKCDGNVLQTVADFVYNNQDFRSENFPFCNNSSQVKAALATRDGWYILESDSAFAVFKLEIAVPTANVEQICVNHDEFRTEMIPKLRDELIKLKVTNITIRVPLGDEKPLTEMGFDKRRSYVKYSRVPEETRMMPILPLTSVTRKELPILSKLMFDSYSKSPHPLRDTMTAEKSLQSIMAGVGGEYVSTASFASGTTPNLVSACFISRNSSEEAKISELFTHPLYRARGLATTEIALAMNRLATGGVRKLVAWNAEENDIVSRLLTKMGFREDRRVAEMVIGA